VTQKVWLNGQILDAEQAHISVADHGLTVGDGVFETMKVIDGVPFALSRHLDRLRGSGAQLGLSVPAVEDLRAALAETVAANDGVSRLRITVTGGVGPAGTERGSAGPTVLVVPGTLPVHAPSIALATVPWARNERSPVAGAKTTSYAENVVALARARSLGMDEALFLDTRGHLSEGTGTNVFVAVGGELFTPARSCGCLAGVTRALVLEWSGAKELEMPVSVLDEADEVFVTSSTRDVQPVHAVDDRVYDTAGPVTASARATFRERAAIDLDP
jgi:branched-chain amino acid aminotransferase